MTKVLKIGKIFSIINPGFQEWCLNHEHLYITLFFLNLFIKACFLGENIANARLE